VLCEQVKGKLLSRLVTMVLLASGLLLAGMTCRADGDNHNGMHWAFSAFFGTGWYEVSNSESVFIMRVPMEQTWRASSLTGEHRSLGVEFHYPVTLGLHSVDNLGDIADFDNFGSVAFTPGVEIEIPVTEKWYLRPVAHVGWGQETDGGDSAWIYYGGIKSRFSPALGSLDWSILNALYYSGYHDNSGDSGSVTTAMAGAEFHHPLLGGFAGRDDLQLNWHLTYSWLFDQAEFSLRNGFSQSIDDQWELGFALAPRNQKFKIWFLSFEQLGLSFHTSSDGEYRAISINASSPFH
jgi:hypothetical protein